jgi:hypothetical protein
MPIGHARPKREIASVTPPNRLRSLHSPGWFGGDTMKIARHAEIEVVLALELTLTETLDRLGLVAVPSAFAYRRDVLEGGRKLYRGTASDIWTWLRMGGTWEDPDA